jgi:hypothetical protein
LLSWSLLGLFGLGEAKADVKKETRPLKVEEEDDSREGTCRHRRSAEEQLQGLLVRWWNNSMALGLPGSRKLD